MSKLYLFPAFCGNFFCLKSTQKINCNPKIPTLKLQKPFWSKIEAFFFTSNKNLNFAILCLEIPGKIFYFYFLSLINYAFEVEFLWNRLPNIEFFENYKNFTFESAKFSWKLFHPIFEFTSDTNSNLNLFFWRYLFHWGRNKKKMPAYKFLSFFLVKFPRAKVERRSRVFSIYCFFMQFFFQSNCEHKEQERLQQYLRKFYEQFFFLLALCL